MTPQLPVPAVPRRDHRTETRVIVHGCHDCRHFRRRPESAPWPVAGAPTAAEGRCGHPRYGNDRQVPEQRRPYQVGTDWCADWKAPGADPVPPPTPRGVAADGGIGEARQRRDERFRVLRGARTKE